MKTIYKILIYAVLILSIFNIFEVKFSYATSIESDIEGFEANIADEMVHKTASLRDVANRFLGFLRIVSILLLVLMIASTGYRYIVATPDVKKEIKDKMLPIIIGLICVYGAIQIASFFLSAMGG